MGRYDAIIHLVSTADGAEEAFYANMRNNGVRREGSLEEALEVERKTKAAYVGHPRPVIVIDNTTDFETKIQKTVNAVCSIVGIPTVFEVERKFLIHYPDLELLEALPNVRMDYIRQDYLKVQGKRKKNYEVRVRMRGRLYDWSFTKTKKIGKGKKRVENEENIDMEQYVNHLITTDPTLHPITKNRYCYLCGSRYFEIDIFPGATKEALCEIEFHRGDENEEIVFPDWISVIREVTDDERYSNRQIAANNPLR